MITQLKRGIPPRAAVAVVALVLLATIVSGREPTEAPPPAAGAGEPGVLARLDADKTSVSRAVRRLESQGEVDAVDGRTALVDPLFSLWIERVASGAFAGGQE